MEREACVCDHGFERSDLCAEIIIIIIIKGTELPKFWHLDTASFLVVVVAWLRAEKGTMRLEWR